MQNNPDKIPELVLPVWEDENITVRQDVEWPVPAFFIVSVKQHIGSISKLDAKTLETLFKVISKVRMGLSELFNIERAQIYHEEKILNPHVHFWILPIWQNIIDKHKVSPKLYDSNIKQYIDLFKFSDTKHEIESCNQLMKQYLSGSFCKA